MDDLTNIPTFSQLGLDPSHPLSTDGAILGQLNSLHSDLDLSGNMMDFILAADAPVSSAPDFQPSTSQTCVPPPSSVPNTGILTISDPLPTIGGDEVIANFVTTTVAGDSRGAGLAWVPVDDKPVIIQESQEDAETAIPVDELVQRPETKAQDEIITQEVTETIKGQAVQLEDGSTALVEESSKDGLHAVHLQDGSVAFITVSAYNQLFSGAEYTGPPVSMVTVVDRGEIETSQTKALRGAKASGKPFRCETEGCGKVYSTQCHLKVHERSHTGDRPFTCGYMLCQKRFSTSYALKAHIRTHTGEKPYICPSCNKGFKTSGDLGKHIRTHTGERPFKCPFEGCDRSFTTSNIRKVHIRVHTGEKPFSCDLPECNKTFSSQTNYKNHMRMHRGEKPYVCTVPGCEKRFTEYSSLYKHHGTHKVKSFIYCGFCGKSYRQSSTLSMHIRTAHAISATSKNRLVIASGSAVPDEASMQTADPKPQDASHLTLRINEPIIVPASSINMKMAVIDDPTLRNLIGKLTAEQIEKTRLGIQIPDESQVAPIALQINGDHALGQLYLVTDPVHLRILKLLLSRDPSGGQSQSSAAAAQTHSIINASFINAAASATHGHGESEKSHAMHAETASLDSESNDLIGQLIGQAGDALASSEIFPLVPNS